MIIVVNDIIIKCTYNQNDFRNGFCMCLQLIQFLSRSQSRLKVSYFLLLLISFASYWQKCPLGKG